MIPVSNIKPAYAFATASRQGLFVAGGQKVFTSPDGYNWTERFDFTGAALVGGLAYNPTTKRVVAALGANNFAYSTDGTNWTESTLPSDTNSQAVVWSANDGQYVMVGGAYSTSSVYTSTNGTSFTQRNRGYVDMTALDIDYSPTLDLYVIAGSPNTGAPTASILTSSDALTWTAYSPIYNSVAVEPSHRAVRWCGSSFGFLATSNNSYRITRSTNGTTWDVILFEASSNYNFSDLAYSPTLNMVAFISPSTFTFSIATTTDLNTYTFRETPTLSSGQAWNSICWSAELGMFVAVGGSTLVNTADMIMTSTDGINWYRRECAIANFQDVIWCNGL